MRPRRRIKRATNNVPKSNPKSKSLKPKSVSTQTEPEGDDCFCNTLKKLLDAGEPFIVVPETVIKISGKIEYSLKIENYGVQQESEETSNKLPGVLLTEAGSATNNTDQEQVIPSSQRRNWQISRGRRRY